MIVVDVTARGVGGRKAAAALNAAGIVCNANSIPFDPRKPWDPSGIRIGTAAIASRGVGADHMSLLAGWIDRVIAAPDDTDIAAAVRAEVREFITAFPAPGLLDT